MRGKPDTCHSFIEFSNAAKTFIGHLPMYGNLPQNYCSPKCRVQSSLHSPDLNVTRLWRVGERWVPTLLVHCSWYTPSSHYIISDTHQVPTTLYLIHTILHYIWYTPSTRYRIPFLIITIMTVIYRVYIFRQHFFFVEKKICNFFPLVIYVKLWNKSMLWHIIYFYR